MGFMLNIVSAKFLKSAILPSEFPQTDFCEFAFFGRSNSGKSSLINMILNRKQLVKTGSTPGVTQTVNFFVVNENKSQSFTIADLPGYGFAKLKKNKLSEINTMLYDYCLNRKNLVLVFLLMDVRRPPAEVEKDICNFFTEHDINFEIVATKADKLSKSEQLKSQKDLAEYFSLDFKKVILTSTLKKQGRDKIIKAIETLLK